MSSKNNQRQQMLQAAVAVNTALNAADCFGFLPVKGTKLNISGLAKVGCLETDEIQLSDNEKKSMCIKEGANEYLCFSTEDGKEMITASKDITHNGNAVRTGNLTQTGDINATGEINAKVGARGTAGNINADGKITAASANVTGTTKTGTVDWSAERRDGLPLKSIYKVFDTIPENTTLDNTGTAKYDTQPTVPAYNQNKADLIDMHNFLQANVENLTTAQLAQMGVRIAAGADTTFTASEVSAGIAAPALSNAGVQGTTTILKGKAGVQDTTGGAATLTFTATSSADGSRLVVFKDVELNLTAANVVLKFTGDGFDQSGCSILLENDSSTTATLSSGATDTETTLTLDGAAGTKFSGFLYIYDATATTTCQQIRGYITSNSLMTAVFSA